MEGVQKVVAETFDVLKERLESGFDSTKLDAEQRQSSINTKLEEQTNAKKKELDELREELTDEIGGTRVEFEAAAMPDPNPNPNYQWLNKYIYFYI